MTFKNGSKVRADSWGANRSWTVLASNETHYWLTAAFPNDSTPAGQIFRKEDVYKIAEVGDWVVFGNDDEGAVIATYGEFAWINSLTAGWNTVRLSDARVVSYDNLDDSPLDDPWINEDDYDMEPPF